MGEPPKTQAATWATRIVARYAQAAEPRLSLTEEDHLRDTLATVLRTVMSTQAVPDWIKAVNLTPVDSTRRCPAFVAHQMSALVLMPCGRGGRAGLVHPVHRLAAKRTYAAVRAGLI